MFYTLVSRSLITKINSSRDYLNIFLVGSIGYVILHWYLYSEKKEGIMEKIREYLYYLMVVDIITSYVLVTFYPSKSDKKTIESEDQIDVSQPPQLQLTPEQRQLIMQRMQNSKRLQQQKVKESLQKEEASGNDNIPNSSTEVVKTNEDTNQNPNLNPNPNPNSNSKQNSTSSEELPKKTKDNSDGDNVPQPTQTKKSIFTKSEESRDLVDTDTNESEKSKDTNKNLKIKKKKDTEISDTELPIFNGQTTRNKKDADKKEKTS